MRTVRNIFSGVVWPDATQLGVLALVGLVAMSAPAQPTNDLFANAQLISGVWGTATGSNIRATNEIGEPSHNGYRAHASIWYKWVAPQNGEVLLDTVGSLTTSTNVTARIVQTTNGFRLVRTTNVVTANMDAVLAVYKGNVLASLSQVAANDDLYPSLRYAGRTITQQNEANQNTFDFNTNITTTTFGLTAFTQPYTGPSGLRFDATAGTTYYIALDCKTNSGSTKLNWAYHSAGIFRFASENIDQTGNVDTNGNNLLLYQCAETEARGAFYNQNRILARIASGPLNAAQYNTTFHTYYNYDVPGVMVTVTRVAGSSGRMLVDYTTMDGKTNMIKNGDLPAVSDVDYIPVSGKLAFDDYEMSKTILIPIIDDFFLAEPNRVFTVALTNVQYAPFEDAANVSPPRLDSTYYQAEVRILDVDIDPKGPTQTFVVSTNTVGTNTITVTNTFLVLDSPTNAVFNFEKAHYRVPRDATNYWKGTPITVYITREGTNTSGQTVFWSVNNYFNDNSAGDNNNNIYFPLDPGSDYATPTAHPPPNGGLGVDVGNVRGSIISDFDFPGGYNGSVTFPAGSGAFQSQPITFTIYDNGLQQFNEDIHLTLYQLDAGGNPIQPGMVNETTVTILYDDLHPPAGSVDQYYNPDFGIDMTPPVNTTLAHPGTDGQVEAVAVQPDDKTIFAGHFGSFNGLTCNGIGRANTNGTLDTTFDAGDGIFSSSGGPDFISSIALQPDGKIIVGGSFPSFRGVLRNGIARLNSDGTLDTSFDPGTGTDGFVRTLALQPDGRVVIGGEFSSVNGVPRTRVARLNADGSLDSTFDPGVNGPNNTVNAMALTTIGQVLVGGDFTQMGTTTYNGLARLTANGALDPTFTPGAGVDAAVQALAVQPDGNILVGGDFLHFNTSFAFGRLVRLTANGLIDTNFMSGIGADDTIYSINVQANGTIYIGGAFTSFNGTHRLGFARLYQDGTVDTTFLDTAYNQFAGVPPLYNDFGAYFNDQISSRGTVLSSGVQSDGNILIAGTFDQVGGGEYSPLVRTNSIDLGDYAVEQALFYIPETKVRDGVRNRNNFARLIGGVTPGPGNISLETSAYSANESQSSLYVNLLRSNGSLGPASANFSIQPGLAQSGTDYVYYSANPLYWIAWEFVGPSRMHSDALSGTNTIMQDPYGRFWSYGNNGPSAVIVSVNQNQVIRGNLNATFQLANPPGADQFYLGGQNIPLGLALGRSSAPLTLIDDLKLSGVFGFGSSTFAGSSNTTPINVTRTNGTYGTVSMNYTTNGGTAVFGQDYRITPLPGALTFNDSQTNKSFTFTILSSNYVTSVEKTVNLTLYNLGGANGGSASFGLTNAVVRIINPNFQGYLNFSSSSYSNNLSGGVMNLTVTRTVGSLGSLSVQFATANGTAIKGQDYVGTTNVLQWNSGDVSSRTISIPLINAGGVGTNKTFAVQLSNPLKNGVSTPSLLGSITNATATIINDNSYGVFQFSAPSYLVNENGGYATITVTRTGGAFQAVTVNYATADGINTVHTGGNPNYVTTGGALNFAAGELSKSFTVTVNDDGFIDPTPFFFNVNLTGSTPSGVFGFQTSAQVQLVDAEAFNQTPGSPDVSLSVQAGMNNAVSALAVQSDGRMVFGGSFTTANSVPMNSIARLNMDGTLDGTFLNGLAGPNAGVNALVVQTDSRIVIGGSFTFVNGVHRNFTARLNVDGSLDTSFNPNAGADGPVNAVAETFISGTRRVYLGGGFGNYNGVARPNIARVNDNGTLDTSFAASGIDGTVFCIVPYPTNSINAGKVLIGGNFIHLNGSVVNGIARLNANGSLDNGFLSGTGASSTVLALAIQNDGRVLVGGSFTNFNGVNLNHVARLNPDGSVDAAFTAGVGVGADDTVDAIMLQPDNRILLGGFFTHANGVTRNRITRLMPNGSVDPTINFGSGANDFVAALGLQNDGGIVLGGGFTSYYDEAHAYLARIYGGAMIGSGRFEFSTGEYAVDETGTNAVLTIRRTGGTAGPNVDLSGDIFVKFDTSDGTAVAGVNYTTVSTNIDFPEGEVIRTVSIPVADDGIITADLKMTNTLSNPTAPAGLGNQPKATLTIINDDSSISLSSSIYAVNKNTPFGYAVVNVLRQGSTNGAATVDFMTTTNGTAINGVDYLAVSNTIIFNPGDSNIVIQIPILNNPLPTGNRTVTMLLTNATSVLSNMVNLILVSPYQATLTIIDTVQAPGQVMFVGTNIVATEANSNVVVTVVRTNGTSGTISVAYNTIPGTAAPGVNYNIAAGTLTFANGETVKTFNLPLLENSLVQGPVTLNLTLSNPTGGATILGSTNLPVTILDNDAGVAFSSAAYVVNETNGSVTLNVLRLNNTSGTVQVSYATTNGSALANTNYLTTSGTLTFNPGESNKSVIIPILHDFRATSNLTFGVNLSNPTAGAQLAFPSTASVIVLDAEAGLGFTNANFSVLKSGTNAILTVFCSNPNAEPISVNYASADGTAVAGIDYGAVSGTLTFTNGAVTNYILVPIVNNTLIEGDLNFTVTLSSPTAPGQLIAPSTATVTITDNNAGLSFSSPTYSVFKNGVSATIGVIRTGFTNSTVSVNYATLDGSGTNGVDYTAVSGTLVFTNGQTSLTFAVPVTDSTTVKPDKTVLLQLSNPVGTNGVLVTPSAALLTIHDNSGSLVVPAGVALLTESGPVNGVIDPSESVSLLFALRNSGGTNTANLTATLLATNGITSPSAAQNYGTLLVNGASASRQYSFIASGSNGQQIVATFLLTNGTVSAGSASFTFTLGSGTTSFTNGGAITIPLQGAASPYASTMNVSGVGGSLTKATVAFNKIYHGSASDIDALLVSPTGQKTLLMANAGGFNGLTGVTLTFDDAAAAYLPQSSPLTSGTNKPTPYFPVTVFPAPAPAAPYTTNLAAFNGSNPNGTWSLYVLDDTAVNSGMISNGWVLNLTGVNLVGATADLVAGMTAASSVIASNNLTYTITVTNYGPSTATGVTLSDTLAASVSLVSSNASQGSVSVVGNQVTWNAGSLLLTNGAVLTLVVKPSTTGILTNNCYVQGNESDPNLVNNAATTTTTVDPIKADLALSLVDAPDPLWSGNNITYTITVTNGGPATAPGVTITNTLPPSVVFVSATPGGYLLSGSVLAFTNLGNVLVGGQTVATIVVRTTTGGTLTNAAFTASQVTDPFKANNSATVKTVVNLLQLGGVKSGNNLVISWPTNTPGYVLESATNLNYPAVWTTVVSPAPVVSGGQFVVTNSIGAGAKFFRLRAP